MAKQRIKNVFIETLQNVRNGKAPAIKKTMLKHGYTESSADTLKVTHTKTWIELKRVYLKDEKALKTFDDLADDTNEDKDNRLKASIEIMKLNDRYPAQKSKVLGLFQTLESIEEWNVIDAQT